MEIRYSTTKRIDVQDLAELFSSVGWESARFPDRLQKAMAGSHRVLTAWDGDKLIGLVNALADGAMTAYFHYLLVKPEYQKRGIGRELITRMLAAYREYYRIVLISYRQAAGFYEKCGFAVCPDSAAMEVRRIEHDRPTG
ncbi:MAG: GNAT family N-acetyltransferase [Sedimentisphaerales bacterium]|nr:GNAT family N-acetyltransferase [Sedimentisphaerales bacterium]